MAITSNLAEFRPTIVRARCMELAGRDRPNIAEFTMRSRLAESPGSIWMMLHRSWTVQSGLLASSSTRSTTVGGDGIFGLPAISFSNSTFCIIDKLDEAMNNPANSGNPAGIGPLPDSASDDRKLAMGDKISF